MSIAGQSTVPGEWLPAVVRRPSIPRFGACHASCIGGSATAAGARRCFQACRRRRRGVPGTLCADRSHDRRMEQWCLRAHDRHDAAALRRVTPCRHGSARSRRFRVSDRLRCYRIRNALEFLHLRLGTPYESRKSILHRTVLWICRLPLGSSRFRAQCGAAGELRSGVGHAPECIARRRPTSKRWLGVLAAAEHRAHRFAAYCTRHVRQVLNSPAQEAVERFSHHETTGSRFAATRITL